MALVVSFASDAPGQDPVLPLPAADQQQIAAHLGAGVVGAARPSEPIVDAARYFPLQEKDFLFRVTSGSHTGDTQTVSLKKARRPAGTVVWRFNFAPTLAGFITTTAEGDLVMSAVSDAQEGVIVFTTPANPFVLASMKPGESRSFQQRVSVNYLDDPTRRDWGGRLDATYTYVGGYRVTCQPIRKLAAMTRYFVKDLRDRTERAELTPRGLRGRAGSLTSSTTSTYVGGYQVTVPAGTFDTILIRFAYRGKVGPADVVYTAWYFFAKDIGLVAMVNLEDVSAFWIYRVDTTIGKVLAAK